LWSRNENANTRAKVAWESVCVPKKECGLGLKRIEEWNRAAIVRHIWKLFTKAGSLWVTWVKENLLKGQSFFQINIPQNCTWSRRKILKLRDTAKNSIKYVVGDGNTIHVWLDW
jgi:hypothetical protein